MAAVAAVGGSGPLGAGSPSAFPVRLAAKVAAIELAAGQEPGSRQEIRQRKKPFSPTSAQPCLAASVASADGQSPVESAVRPPQPGLSSQASSCCRTSRAASRTAVPEVKTPMTPWALRISLCPRAAGRRRRRLRRRWFYRQWFRRRFSEPLGAVGLGTAADRRGMRAAADPERQGDGSCSLCRPVCRFRPARSAGRAGGFCGGGVKGQAAGSGFDGGPRPLPLRPGQSVASPAARASAFVSRRRA